MSETEILERIRLLPKDKQAVVFDFLDYLVGRFGSGRDSSWTERGFAEFGLGQALRGMEDDPVSYSAEEIQRPWR